MALCLRLMASKSSGGGRLNKVVMFIGPDDEEEADETDDGPGPFVCGSAAEPATFMGTKGLGPYVCDQKSPFCLVQFLCGKEAEAVEVSSSQIAIRPSVPSGVRASLSPLFLCFSVSAAASVSAFLVP